MIKLTKNLNFINFSYNKNNNKKKIKNILSEFSEKKLISKYPFLKSLKFNYDHSFNKKNLKKFNKYKEYNLIGMGGSTLGSESIYYFLKHKIKRNFFFFNNLQSNQNFKSKIKRVNIIISKSGNTLETIANYKNILNKQTKNKNLFITEFKKNKLYDLAKKLKADLIEHKNYIGGRYSVLSEVGMLPAQLMGLNINKFKRLNYLLKNKNFMSSLVQNVFAINKYIIEGKKNLVILNYDEKSDSLFKWYQQLTAESLGKNGNGLFPIVSTMPKDNHSLLQLYLDGPKNNFFTFFSVNEKKNVNSKLNSIINAQKKATQLVFKRKKINFRSFEVLNRDEETLGELFAFFILETLLLANFLKVNPLNQPSVELIKVETKKILN